MKIYLLIFFIIIFFLFMRSLSETEEFGNFYSPCKTQQILKEVFDDYKYEYNKDNWEYYIPCTYNTCEKKIIEFENDKVKKKIFLLDGCDTIASKRTLWKTIQNFHGDKASLYMPITHILLDINDMKLFEKHFEEKSKIKKNHMFVLKNYRQRQEGIKLVNTLEDIKNAKKDGYILVQDYLYNPFLIAKRKVNFRYYTLIVCKDGKIDGYIHRNGFVYYTPDEYDENKMEFKRHITTGYIDRKIYDTNPLTLEDFRMHLENIKIGLSKQWDNNVRNLLYNVMKALSLRICKNDNLNQHIRFQLFGSDVAITDDLNAYLMEINKGPDLNAKDERDKKVKKKVQEDIFKIMENINENNFEKIF